MSALWKLINDRFPTERQWVTIAILVLIYTMLIMADNNPLLWKEETFKDIFKTIVLTGFLNMVLAFHFSANKLDEGRVANTGKMADAMKSLADNAAPGGNTSDALKSGDAVTINKDDTT